MVKMLTVYWAAGLMQAPRGPSFGSAGVHSLTVGNAVLIGPPGGGPSESNDRSSWGYIQLIQKGDLLRTSRTHREASVYPEGSGCCWGYGECQVRVALGP